MKHRLYQTKLSGPGPQAATWMSVCKHWSAVGTSCCLPIGWQQLGWRYHLAVLLVVERDRSGVVVVDAWLELELSAE